MTRLMLRFSRDCPITSGPETKQVLEGYSVFVDAYVQVGDKVRFTLALGAYPEYWIWTFHSSGRNTWEAPASAVVDPSGVGNGEPKDQGGQGGSGLIIRLPGFSGTYRANQAILPGGSFTWGEALHASKTSYRVPDSPKVVHNIIRVAGVMQEVRDRFRVPIRVNSWYRDPVTNRRVGGASQSRHLVGDAVDFVVSGVSPGKVYRELDDWWGNQGGLASSSTFTHIDGRGYKARWAY